MSLTVPSNVFVSTGSGVSPRYESDLDRELVSDAIEAIAGRVTRRSQNLEQNHTRLDDRDPVY
jgi:hypothetical protein